jgi:uncharacterized protein (TIGR02001 family)
MRTLIHKLAIAGVAMSVMTLSMPAFAQDSAAAEPEAETKPITLTGSVAVVSDYRFRGVSLSNKKFAVQPTLTVTADNGAYVGVWGSNLAPNPGDDVEVDIYAGYAGGSDALTYDLGATYYVYPGVSDFNYIEFTGKTGTTVGPAKLGLQVSYAPKQGSATSFKDNLYIGANASVGVPGTPLTATASVGRENGSFGAKKIDWSLGLSATVKGFTLGASYVDTNRNTNYVPGDSKAGAVFSISYGF